MSDDVLHQVDATEVNVDSTNLQNASGDNLQQVVESIDAQLVDIGQRIPLTLYWAGIIRPGAYILGSPTQGYPAPKTGRVVSVHAHAQTPLQGLVTIRIRNLTQNKQTLFVLAGDGSRRFFPVNLAATLDLVQGDQMSVVVEDVHHSNETGGDLNIILTIE